MTRVWVKIFAVGLLLLGAAGLAACGVKVGPMQELVIEEPLGGSAVMEVVVKMGAGSLGVEPGAPGLLSGVIRYNVASWKPTVKRSESRLTIEQGSPRSFATWPGSITNQWQLRLGKAPLALVVTAGAYDGRYELGGLTLTSLHIKDGAAKARVTFSEPNPGRLQKFDYETGASTVTLNGLGNANFELLEFTGGAGEYTLDFSGELRMDGRVRVKTGASKVRLVIPAGVAVQVHVEGSLNDVSTEGTWTKTDKIYRTEIPEGPVKGDLDIVVELSVGKLELVVQ